MQSDGALSLREATLHKLDATPNVVDKELIVLRYARASFTSLNENRQSSMRMHWKRCGLTVRVAVSLRVGVCYEITIWILTSEEVGVIRHSHDKILVMIITVICVRLSHIEMCGHTSTIVIQLLNRDCTQCGTVIKLIYVLRTIVSGHTLIRPTYHSSS